MSDSQVSSLPVGSPQARAGSASKIYRGRRKYGMTARVTVNRRPLNPRRDLWSHWPGGFEWSYGGSGPAQLALALLADHLGDDERAVRLHQEFKWAVVARLPHHGWDLTSWEIDEAVALLEGEIAVEEALNI